MKDYSNYYGSSKDKLISDGKRLFQLNLQGFDGVDVLVNGEPRKLIIAEKYSVKEYLQKVIDESGRLKVGDLIFYKNANWLVRKIDKENPVFDTGTIEYSPSSLKWMTEQGDVEEYNFIFNSENLSNFGVEDGRVISLPNDRRNIAISSTPQTKSIKIHQRFIFDNSAWKVISINRLNPLIEMILESDAIDTSKDNIELRIADYVKPNYIIDINQDNINLRPNDTFQLSVSVSNNGTPLIDPVLVYSSSNPSICSVDDNGLITALDKGSTTITIAYKDLVRIVSVTVTAEETHNYSVVISGDSTITRSKTKTYTCIFYDNDVPFQMDGIFNLTDLNDQQTSLAVIVSQSNNSCTVRGDSLGYVNLYVSSIDGKIITSKQIQIKSAI